MVDGWISCYMKSFVGKLTSKLHISCIMESSLQCSSYQSVETDLFKDETRLVKVKSGQKNLKRRKVVLWSLCSLCSNLQGRSWWLRSHLIINAAAVKLCNRSRRSDYCWGKVLLKQEQGEAAGTRRTSFPAEGGHAGFDWLVAFRHFLGLKVLVRKKDKLVRLVTHFIILWHDLCCRRFPCEALIKVFSAGRTGSPRTRQCHISPQGSLV